MQFRNWYLFIVAVLLGLSAYGQQDLQYTQYMYSQQLINPAYVGSLPYLSATAFYRSQWVGVSGAPENQSLNLHSPMGNERSGLGFSWWRDALGPSEENSLTADYSYGIYLNDELRLNLGLKAGVHWLRLDFNRIQTVVPGDPRFAENQTELFPQIGLGAFLYKDNYYVGFSIPNLVESKHFNSQLKAREETHYYLTAGYVYEFHPQWKFKPATLLKYVSDAPLNIDLTANFMYDNFITLGIAYRWDAALSALLAVQINPQLQVGFGYDREVTSLGATSFNSGSFEFFLQYQLSFKTNGVMNPRFF